MTRIYLIRHAEAEGNLYRVAQGQHESLVTDRGFAQIAALKKRFAEIKIDAVYSSDLYRTCVTAGVVYLPQNLPLHRMPELREICLGDWEQKTWGEIYRDTPEQMENFSLHLDRWRIDGAERAEEVRDRVLDAVRRIARENEGKTVAVFSHGCAIRILLATLQGIGIDDIGQSPLGSNTAVSLLEAEGDDLRVVFRDDISHLPEELRRKRGRPLDPGLIFTDPDLTNLPVEMHDWVRESYQECGIPSEQADAVLLGRLNDQPVGLLQMDSQREADRKRGWISLFYIDSEFRRRGYGVQLLGQAVYHYRPLGRETLCVALPEGAEAAEAFFTAYGFRPTGETTEQGEAVLEKDIAFRPLPGLD